MKDFFISYTQADLARARWINDLLVAAGYTTIAQFKDMPPGSNFVIEMDEAVKQARQTIAVLSPDYLASDYCQQELAAAIRSDPKSKKRLLIPVRVRRCDPEGLLGPIVYIDLVGKDDETAKELLLSGVKGQTPARIEPPAGRLLQQYFDQLREKYGKLSLLGETETHELKRVFVELTINETFSRPTANDEWMGMWDVEFRKRYQPFASQPDEERETPRRIKPEDLLKRRSPAVIAGAPGCGKTTLMRWLALQVCDENSKRIPIFVELKGLSQKSFESVGVRLESVLFDHAAESLKKSGATEVGREQLREEFARRLKSGEIVALLDGLDEVRGWEHFHHLCDAIDRFAEDHGDNLMIISSRPFALRDRRFGNSQGAEEMEIAPFNRDQIALFLDHYYGEDESRKLLPKLMHPDLRDLVSVPTLIGAIVRRIRESGKVETDRLKLYEAIVADLSGKFDSAKNVSRFKQNDDAAAMRRQDFLAELAFTRLFDDTLDQGKNAERLAFTTGDIKIAAQRFCRENKLNVDPYELTADAIATPLLAEMAEDVWKFSHLTLQEYLAARALAAHPDCESIFVRACFHPLLVEMETLPMALGRVRNPNRLYETLEQLPESLDYKLLRLRARGLASAKVNPQTLQKLLHRLDDFITSEMPIDDPYLHAVVRAFAQARGEALDAVALSVAARLDGTNNSSVRCCAADVLRSIGSERAVDTLLKALLEDQEYFVRRCAAEALGHIGSERAVDALLKALLEDQEYFVRRCAAEALGHIGSERAVDALLKALLEDQESKVRAHVVEALGHIGSERAVDALLKALLEDQESKVRAHVVETLGRIGSERAVDALLKALLEDQESKVRASAAEALGRIGSKRAVDALLKALLEDQDFSVRGSVAEALDRIGSERAVDALIKALFEDQNSAVRGSAAEALGRISSECAVDALLKALLEDQDFSVRSHAAETLGRIGSERTVDSLLKVILDAQDSSVRSRAAEALGRIGSERAVDALIKALLEDQDSSVRSRAAEALGRTGSERAVDALIKALLSAADSSVRLNAAIALGRIGSERAVDVLLKALHDDADYFVRLGTANALGRIGDEHAMNALIQTLLSAADSDSDARASAAEALENIGSDRAVDALLQALLDDTESTVRACAAGALSRTGSERAVDALRQALLNDTDSSVRWRAAEAMGNINIERAVDVLLHALLNDAESDVRASAVKALGRIGSDRLVDALPQALLNDANPYVRKCVAEALKCIGSECAVDALIKALLEDQEPVVRESAIEALGNIGSERAVDSLLKATLEAQDSSVRLRAVETLGRIRSECAVDALRKSLLEAQMFDVRESVASALGSIGSERAVDALFKALLEDQVFDVRESAASALGSIAAEKAERFAAGLMLALASEAKSVRRKAAEVVAYYVNEACLAELERLAATDESGEVKDAARLAVEKVKRKRRYFGADSTPL